ncbi:ABC transporter permease [Haloferula sp.]|uniref:ABC transporter permease n=1 Tax=Haloferula sp. TaxID=2497595 RepID=UPI00329D1C5F
MKKTLGIFLTLIVLYGLTAWLGEGFLGAYNQEKLLERTALFGILGIGVAFVIITGGIDLSIGSVVCLVGCGVPWLLVKHDWSPGAAVTMAFVVSGLIGLVHGLLITKLKLQPFVVTLCGLLVYRGITRGFTEDQSQGFGGGYSEMRQVAIDKIPLAGGFGIPWTWVILLVVVVLAWVFLNRTIYGRYLRALGNNEEAARFSGVNTDRMVILAYVVCSTLAGLGGVLFVMNVGSAQPSDFGNFYELYAIAAAVLGGCSLRGGEGTVIGVVIGAAVMQVLKNMINLVSWIPTHIEFAVVGAVILAAVVIDEFVKRAVARRRLS